MKKFFALIIARNKEFYRDHGTLLWTLLFPFIVIAGFTYGYSGRPEPVLRFVVTPSTSLNTPALQGLKDIPGVNIVLYDNEVAALKKLERFDFDLSISMSSDMSSIV